MTLGLGDLAFLGGLGTLGRWDAYADLVANLAGTPANPNGAWRFGGKTSALSFYSSATLQPGLGWNGPSGSNTPFFYAEGGSYITSHVPLSESGTDVAATIRWTAPASMVVSIDARIIKVQTGGNGVRFRLRTTADEILNESPAIQGPTGSHEYFNASLSVVSGQVLDFDVDSIANNTNDLFRYDRIIIEQVS